MGSRLEQRWLLLPFVMVGLLSVLLSGGCGSEPCQVTLGAPLSIVSVAPPHGAVNIAVDTDVIVAFSDELVEETVTEAVTLRDEDVVVEIETAVGESGKVITMQPVELLQPMTTYYLSIAPDIEGVHTGALDVQLQYRFTTR